jgi:DNA replication protein DnaC
MSSAEPPVTISVDLRKVLRRLRLSPMLETLPERITLARQRSLPLQDFLLTIFTDEVERRDRAALKLRVHGAKLDGEMRLENWDETAKVSYDRELWAELCTLRFLESRQCVLLLGPVGVGKTFLANSLGHIACRRGYSTQMIRAEHLFKHLKACRLDNTYEREMRRLLGLDLLILDDFGLDQMDATESRDFYDLVVERHGKGSMVVSSNRDPEEWLGLMADMIRAQSAVDRLQNSAFELVIEGESYRKRQKPSLSRSNSKRTSR